MNATQMDMTVGMPARLGKARFAASLLVGYLVCSNLNWLVAEMWLNPVIEPGLNGMMATGADVNFPGLFIGFFMPVLVTAILLAMLPSPRGWVARALTAGGLVSLTTFFGAYGFLAGWTTLPMAEMMLTAVADSSTILVGALVIAFIQGRGR